MSTAAATQRYIVKQGNDHYVINGSMALEEVGLCRDSQKEGCMLIYCSHA